MIHAHVSYFSQVLSKHTSMNVLIPEQGKPPFATMYLLHGLSDDYSAWMRRTRIEDHASKLPLMIVMPDGYRGFYTDNVSGPAYGRYIGEEVPALIERNFPAKATRMGRCLTGLSMGGYGALRLAMKYPQRFASAVSHSGAVHVGQKVEHPSWIASEMPRIVGLDPTGSDHDLYHLAMQCKRGKCLPSLRIDCGREDHLLQHNRLLHRFLTRNKIPHEYAEFPGGHTWDYWDLHVQDALKFHARVLKLKAFG